MFLASENKKVVMAVVILSVLFIVFGLIWQFWYLPYAYKQIKNFDDCAKRYPVMESYPAQCNTPDNRHFVQDIDPTI